MTVALQVRGLMVDYRGVTVVHGLDLELDHGRILALVGPNGAGKTSTLEAIVGLRPARSGTIRILGREPADAIRDGLVGVMLQTGGPYPSARPAQWIAYLGRLNGRRVDAAARLAEVGIDAGRKVLVRRMSGGEVQRVKLAAALINDPPLLILDEPTSGLDAAGRTELLERIAAWRSAGRSIVMTTHRLDDVEQIADDVVVLANGRVAASGSPGDLAGKGTALRFQAPPHLPIDDVVPRLAAMVEGPVTAAESTPGSYVVTCNVTPEAVARVVAWCAEHGAIPDHLRTDRHDLADVIANAQRREDDA